MQRRQFVQSACLLGAMVPLLKPGAVLAQTGDDALLAHVHPDLRPILKQYLPIIRAAPPFTSETLPTIRAQQGIQRPRLADIPFETRQISGAPGQPDIRILIVNASKSGDPKPALLHTHGGGFVTGKAEDGLTDLQEICREVGCVMVSVDYRLAPEASYKQSTEETYVALKWLHDNAGLLNVDPSRIGVMGESAGGGHAALLAIKARDRGEIPLMFQCLIYPMLDDRTGSTRQAPSHVAQFGWTADRNRFGWASFLGMRPGGRNVPVEAVPARQRDLHGLPPGFIGVGTIDLFHDEDVDYAQRLNDAGVPTELVVVPGAFHGFDLPMINAPVSKRFTQAKYNALRQGLRVA